jgi:hypothetical protein
VLSSLRASLTYWYHKDVLARVLRAPPARVHDDGVIVFSQVRDRDFLMYLLAAKSFARFAGIGRFAVLDDGTLTPEHHALLASHLPGIEITPIGAVRSAVTPAGGTWERLNKIVELAERAYVIQLDADTVTVGPVPEVVARARNGTAFTLVSEADACIEPLSAAAARVRANPSPHVQIAAEQALAALEPQIGGLYARGCSAFTGFPPGHERRDRIEAFSRAMRERLGERWSEWGTEQVTSNFIFANTPGAQLLPLPRYCNYVGEPVGGDTRFLHFVGSHRFKHGVYRRMAADAIRTMTAALAA